MQNTSIQVIEVPIGQLLHDADNPNKMSDDDFAQMVANIRASGVMLQPILVKKANEGWKIVDGHHRARASADAGLESIMAVVWDGSEAMRRALGVSFNRLRGALDLAGVQRIFTELHDAGWAVDDMRVTGYSEQEITDLLQIAGDVSPDDLMQNPIAPEEATPEAPARPLVIELTFTEKAGFQRAKRALRKAAGKGAELSDGLLVLLNQLDGDAE